MTLSRRCLLAAAGGLAFTPALAASPEDNKLYPESRLTVLDRISVEVAGTGPDLILVPGLTCHRAVWKATSGRLKAKHRLHLVQIAGFAGEPARANAAGEVLAPTAEAIAAYVRQANIGPALYVGHSLGGTIGLHLAQKHPQLLKRAMLVDALPFLGVVMGFPTPEAAKPMVQAMLQSGRDTRPAAMVEQQNRSMVTAVADQDLVIAWGKASDPAVVTRFYGEDLLLDMRPGLATTRVPITVLHPDNVSTGAPKGMMAQVYGEAFAPLPDKRVIEVENARHFIMLDQPAVFASRLDQFLAG